MDLDAAVEAAARALCHPYARACIVHITPCGEEDWCTAGEREARKALAAAAPIIAAHALRDAAAECVEPADMGGPSTRFIEDHNRALRWVADALRHRAGRIEAGDDLD